MSPLQVRTITRAPVTSGAAARLELLEYFLVHSEDIVRCAQAGLEWLARCAGIRQAACLAVDTESNMLVGIAGVGLRIDDVELFTSPLSDVKDPLVAVLSAAQPAVFKASRSNGHAGRSVQIGRAHI